MNTNRRLTAVLRDPSLSPSPVTLWSCVLGFTLCLGLATSRADQVATPVISPIPTAQQEIDGFSPVPAGSGNPPITLTMTCATEGATIFYTEKDMPIGSIPTYLAPYDPENKPTMREAGTRYVGAMAVKPGMDNSDVVWQAYKVYMPVIDLSGYLGFSSVEINTTAEKLLTIRNTGNLDLNISGVTLETDDPGAWSHNLTAPEVVMPMHVLYIKVTFAPTEVKSYAVSLTIDCDAPVGTTLRTGSGKGFDPAVVAPITITSTRGEPYYAPVEIQFYSETSGASIRYTIDGSEPTEGSNLYNHLSKPTLMTLGDVVVKARGYKDGVTPSEVASKTFHVVERELTATEDFFYDPTKIGEFQDKTLTLTNVGSRPIEINQIVSDSENWSIPDWTGPVTIAVGSLKDYTVRFNPKERFDLFATVTIKTNANGGDITRYVNGFALASGYGLDPETKTVSSEGETYTVYVDGSAGVEATESLDWVSLNVQSINQLFHVTVEPNTTGVAREGTVAVGELTHTVIQEAPGAEASIDPVSKEIGNLGGVYSIEVDITGAWDVVEESDWILVDKSSGSDSETLSVTISGNPNATPREGTIGIGSLTHTVTQEGKPPTLDPAEKEVGSAGGSYTIDVNIITMWDVVESLDWVVVSPMAGDGYGSVTVTVDENTLEEVRPGSISIGGFAHSLTQGAATGVDPVAVPQFSPDPATGPFTDSVSVSLTTTTEGATIRYAFTEGVPSESWTVFAEGSPIVLEETTTIWAYASKGGATDSEVVSATYTVTADPSRVAKPSLSPNASAGPFVGPQEIHFSSATEGASFLYSHVENAPRESWIAGDSVELYYQAPVWVMAIKDEMTDSLVAHGLYRIRASYSGKVKIGPLEVATWIIVLEADGSGVLQVFPAEGDPMIYDILIGVDGGISATVREYAIGAEGTYAASSMGGTHPMAGLAPDDLNLAIGPDGSIAGSYGDLGSVEGAIDPVTATGEGTCGVYEVPMLYADAGVCHALIRTNGEINLIIVNPAGIELCSGDLDAGGQVVMTTSEGSSADVTVSSDRTMEMNLTPAGSDEPVEYSGLSAGETGVNRLVNLSTRGHVGIGAQNMIAGFVITGTVSKPVLIRAMGPTLAESFGMAGTVADPMIEVIPLGGTTVVASNDDWENTQAMLDAIGSTGAFAAHAAGSKDAMLLTELNPGGYTATISGVGETEGVAIVEVYAVDDLDTPEARQVNISTRGYIGAGDSVMIMGLVASGNTPRQFLIRAVGPSLSDFGITGVLEDPVLSVVRSTDLVEVATNDDWDAGSSGDDIVAMSQQLGAFALPRGSKDAVLLISLPPTSPFTVVISGKDGATGVAIAEVYEVP